MKKLVLLIILLGSFVSFSQENLSEKEKAKRQKNLDAVNPFHKFGYKAKVATLSKGKYLEMFITDSIVQIGSFHYNILSNRVTGFTQLDTLYSEATLRPEVVSRWINPDPLSDEFPDKSPYNFVNNNPIRFVDPTGMAPEEHDWEWNINSKTGELTKVGDKGGDEHQYVYRNNDKSKTILDYKGSHQPFVGPLANTGSIEKRQEWHWGVSSHDIWSGVPDEYLGHYSSYDLVERYMANKHDTGNPNDKIQRIKLQESFGLERWNMHWTNTEYKKLLYKKYGSDSGLMVAFDQDLLMYMLPSGSLGKVASRGSNYLSKLANGNKGKSSLNPMFGSHVNYSSNPWIRFLQKNKGQYKGSNWLNQARMDYYKYIK